jgi:hypothetical protein
MTTSTRFRRTAACIITAALLALPAGTASAADSSLSGTIVDAVSGEPLDGCVDVLQSGTTTRVAQVETNNGSGAWSVAVPAGSYQLYVYSGCLSGDPLPTYPSTYYSFAFKQADAAVIAVGDGESVANIRIKVAEPGSVSGRVIDAAGNPVAQALVRAVNLQSELVATDSSGRFTMGGIIGPNGELDVIAKIGIWEYESQFGDPVVVDMFGDTTDTDEAIPVRVLPGSDTSGITIVLGGPDPTNVDVPDSIDDVFGNAFAGDILWLQRANITQGCNPPANTLFCPDAEVTRGQMAAFLVRALGLTESDPNIDFSDDNGSVFEADIEKLATRGITTGCGGDRFCPDDPVTRGQMAAFLVRALGYTDQGNTDFTDDNDSVFEADIERLAAAGVTTGCGGDRFCPNDNVTRGQMAAFLRRALGS